MVLEKIVTLANRGYRLRFLAMERSLRRSGCDLPLWVIPYDDDLFELPEGATWWRDDAVIKWLQAAGAHPMMRKYQCLLTARYQYVDGDVIFLRNPAVVLENETGLVASCGHWHEAGHTVTPESAALLRRASTLWQRDVFNAGQFACDQALYDREGLIATASAPDHAATCLQLPYHDQPGLNLLVNLSGVPVHNLTLPPVRMESTWAGDYPDADYAATWTEKARAPYLIHWAGCDMAQPRPIDRLFLDYLTPDERKEWDASVAAQARRERRQRLGWRPMLRKAYRGGRAFLAELRG